MHRDTRDGLLWGKDGNLTGFSNALGTIGSDMSIFIRFYSDDNFKSILSRLAKSSASIKDKLRTYFSGAADVLTILNRMGVLKNSQFNEIDNCINMLSNIDTSNKDEVEDLFFLRGKNPSVEKIDDTSAKLSSLLGELGSVSSDIFNECGNVKTNKWRTN